MDNQKQELIKKLKDANNILVTVSANPSVDQLAACIGITLFLNKLKKHATAVFSGEVPSTLQFLKPEDTLEKNTDSLRDFIVSLDKSKADKLRYKVEDNIVKIFITPYKTSITQDDLDFSQGDFNVDVVLCLGVEKQQDLDQAITSHGRILHDATVASVSIGSAGELGTLNWVEPQASSLSELTYQIANALDKDQLDGQIATSLLTGIVAETDRFSNDKTSPTTMKVSAELMAAGANQQLVASELQTSGEVETASAPAQAEVVESGAGTLEIGHAPEAPAEPVPAQASDTQLESAADVEEDGIAPLLEGDGQTPGPASRLILQPPSMGGTLTANSKPEGFDPSIDPLSLMNSDAPMLNHDPVSNENVAPVSTENTENVALPTVQPPAEVTLDEPVVELPTESIPPSTDKLPDFEPLPSEPAPAATATAPEPPVVPTTEAPQEPAEQSLTDLEQAVDSPHAEATNTETGGDNSLDAARAAIMDAQNSAPDAGLPQPLQAAGAEGYLNVQDLPDSADAPAPPSLEATPVNDVAPLASSPADTPLTMPTPPSLTIPTADPTPPTSVANDPAAAPPVPPPLPIDFNPPK
ncbi:MAG TPA: hypothetical protein VN031_01385 [Candidatus Microsaccharimonas sp.]|nr:hypothetical protein [Candidatus Microsaccharimonas sp.]